MRAALLEGYRVPPIFRDEDEEGSAAEEQGAEEEGADPLGDELLSQHCPADLPRRRAPRLAGTSRPD